MESLTPTTPIALSSYKVDSLWLNWRDKKIKVVVSAPSGEGVVVIYSGTVATTLMNQLNKVDLSVSSLQKRILERLVADGKIPTGTVTGTPD